MAWISGVIYVGGPEQGCYQGFLKAEDQRKFFPMETLRKIFRFGVRVGWEGVPLAVEHSPGKERGRQSQKATRGATNSEACRSRAGVTTGDPQERNDGTHSKRNKQKRINSKARTQSV